jgi:hypothetical protein
MESNQPPRDLQLGGGRWGTRGEQWSVPAAASGLHRPSRGVEQPATASSDSGSYARSVSNDTRVRCPLRRPNDWPSYREIAGRARRERPRAAARGRSRSRCPRHTPQPGRTCSMRRGTSRRRCCHRRAGSRWWPSRSPAGRRAEYAGRRRDRTDASRSLGAPGSRPQARRVARSVSIRTLVAATSRAPSGRRRHR